MIFNYAISPYDDWHRQAWAGGFVLLSGVFATNILARLLVSRQTIGITKFWSSMATTATSFRPEQAAQGAHGPLWRCGGRGY